MSSPYDTKAFKKLQKTWYAKLAKSGFEDAEDSEKEHSPLKRWDNHYFFRRYSPTTFEAKRAYYDTASQWGATYAFPYAIDREIWSLHCEGYSIREIEKKLDKYKDYVHQSILRSREICFGRRGKK
jgi:hypothetical protein